MVDRGTHGRHSVLSKEEKAKIFALGVLNPGDRVRLVNFPDEVLTVVSGYMNSSGNNRVSAGNFLENDPLLSDGWFYKREFLVLIGPCGCTCEASALDLNFHSSMCDLEKFK